jgi:hydrogenase nickel incorporation protein HypA/HybF
MHELSIAQAVVEQVEEAARREGASRVTSVTLTVGQASGVEREALKMAFPAACDGTMARDARLVLDWVPARVYCRACDAEHDADFPFFVCPVCGAADIDVVAGRELMIRSIEMDVPAKKEGDPHHV